MNKPEIDPALPLIAAANRLIAKAITGRLALMSAAKSAELDRVFWVGPVPDRNERLLVLGQRIINLSDYRYRSLKVGVKDMGSGNVTTSIFTQSEKRTDLKKLAQQPSSDHYFEYLRTIIVGIDPMQGELYTHGVRPTESDDRLLSEVEMGHSLNYDGALSTEEILGLSA